MDNAEYQLDLDPTRPLLKGRAGGDETGTSIPVAVGPDDRMGVALECGEYIVTPELLIGPESLLALNLHVDPGATGKVGVSCKAMEPPGSGWHEIAVLTLDAFSGQMGAEIQLSGFVGTTVKLKVERQAPGAGSIHLQLLRVAPRLRAGRVNAFASYDFRLRNEVAHFSSGEAYKHKMYGDEPESDVPSGVVRSAAFIRSPEIDQFDTLMRQRIARQLRDLSPLPGEVAYNFATRALGALLPMQPPNFFARAKQLAERKPLKLLSILSGAARVEDRILEHCGDGVELTLLDASLDLAERAAARLKANHPGATVDCLVGDVNECLPGSGRFDVIVCVSALHHVANLEQVLSQVNARLEDDGEFWSIGEQIGRNGNRLWPETLRAANEAFSSLPERLRRNALTGAIDSEVSDKDFSVGCFEGIRSEELEAMLEAYLVPEHVYKRNAFLWRLVDHTYGDNFVLTDEEDVQHLKNLVAADALHWVSGGRSTELHGAYRKKYIVG